MEKIKVLIVDDSAFMRKLIADFLSEDSRITVVGTARNGEDGIQKMKELQPDVVTLDVEMPVLDGLSALKRIMEENPVPVIMLSSTTKEGADDTVRAIQMGAIDFIGKPSGSISLDLYKVKQELVEKVVSASSVKLKTLLNISANGKSTIIPQTEYSKIELSKEHKMNQKSILPNHLNKKEEKLLLIGTSTGGPKALQHVLTKLPKDINAAILIVQHMPPNFTKSLANRLDSLCTITVKEAENGELIQKGVAYIAPGGFHLKVKIIGGKIAIHLDQSEPVNGHRPSVDVLFHSVSLIHHYPKIAVIMTGMGSDGKNGLLALVNAGEITAIAESEETSIVFGMPKAAIATTCINEVQNVENIAKTIMKYV
ncbi:protein-glutamate methylesterase/protein-glutamine glutaminase [Niallia sp. 01092]|uniref:protein-glutamate methylesterase/protein-glutamine glutaminase n=1 Tax=unclassified Niallia TaxID=2837522 RepID=UPI003FD6404F